VPGPTPIPRGPTVLTLYGASDLLTGPGCPVCRYAEEAADRYLAWFALEGHADTVTITRLCSSLGMCPRHTRGLMSQPGAAGRLTAVYRYVMAAARDRLSGRAGRVGRCPGCEHDDGAADRALEILIDGLADDAVRERYRELGGLCLPHVRSASVRGGQRLVAWLSHTAAATVVAYPTPVGWLAGADRDAEVRAVLRRASPASARPGSGVCLACLAAGHAEQSHLDRIGRVSDHSPDRRLLLCAGHLAELTILTGRQDAAPMLAWQAGCLAASLNRVDGIGRLWSRRYRADGSQGCPVCLAAEHAAQRALEDLRVSVRGSQPTRSWLAPLCVQHLLGLRAVDRRAAGAAVPAAAERAGTLIAELNEAFGKGTWARRQEARGPEMTAWRRAAAFLNGGVFCGCPPYEPGAD
jgi:hypothetical protein